MKIETQKIINSCTNRETYKRGKIINELGDISNFIVEDDGESLILSANVEGSYDNQYDVEAVIDPLDATMQILRTNCTCPAYRKYSGNCKHIAALLLEYNRREREIMQEMKRGLVTGTLYHKLPELFEDEDMDDWNEETELSSPEIKNLMNYFVMQERNQFCQENGYGDIELELTFHIEAERASFDLRIGNQKKYVVKDISELIDNIKHMREKSYGKNLTFIHSQSAFTKESLPIVQFLMDVDSEEENAYHYYGWEYTSSQMRRSYTVSPAAMDHLMELYEGKELMVDDQIVDEKQKMPVIRENPHLPMWISGRRGMSGAEITVDNIHLLEGNKNWYILWENKIYICTREYYDQLKGFLKLMAKNRMMAKYNYFFIQYERLDMERPVFYLSRQDFTTFTVSVLPQIAPLLNVMQKNIELESFQPSKAEFNIYLDAENGMIKCKAEAVYGEEKYNLLKLATNEQTQRDIKAEYEVRTSLTQYFREMSEDKEFYVIVDDEDAMLRLLEFGVEQLNEIAHVYATDAFKKMRIIPTPKVTTGISINGNLMELTWDLNGLDVKELESILADYHRKKTYHRLKNGDFMRIEDSAFAILSEMNEGLHLSKEELKKGKAILPMYRALYLDSLMRENTEKIRFDRDSHFRTLIREMKATQDSDFVLPKNIGAQLRPYQENGYQWLCTLDKYHFGGILADDMGLGKTLQIIVFLQAKKKGTSLVISPASLVYNWESECHRFAPDLKVMPVVGTAEEREQIIADYKKYDVLLTSYDLLKRDIESYEGKQFQYQIIDEAQYIKNANTQAAKAVKAIESQNRFALTGTPIENRLSELWSIFEYLMPGYLFSYNRFKTEIEKPIVEGNNEQELQRLQRMIRPFILRRLKKDVLKELPDKIEKVVYAKMNEEQDKLYKSYEKKLVDSIENQTEKEYKNEKIQILAALTVLRQICCDPALCFEDYHAGASKLDTAVELIENSISAGHKILLFSQFATMLDRIREQLEKKKISVLMLTGKTNKEQRRQMVADFQEGQAEVFLISLKAGGTGLNLTAADVVIHFDPWWNIAAQNQATDRAHRIGQAQTVTVVKLIAKDSIEERILRLQERKKDLAESIISEEGFSLSKVSKEELLDILETRE